MLTKPHHFRIISGKWKRRLLSIPSHAAVRPTPDRVRETLFNWLMHDIAGAVCLDAFAGSGALGLEALSRGASHVYFIEQQKTVLELLRQHLATLDCKDATLVLGTMPQALKQLTQALDIVFLDPPFEKNEVVPSLNALTESALITPNTLIYVEVERRLALEPLIEAQWEILKQSKAGNVRYFLLKKRAFIA
jgi:16S rRNA (guanine966-N2)-methyltransferase